MEDDLTMVNVAHDGVRTNRSWIHDRATAAKISVWITGIHFQAVVQVHHIEWGRHFAAMKTGVKTEARTMRQAHKS